MNFLSAFNKLTFIKNEVNASYFDRCESKSSLNCDFIFSFYDQVLEMLEKQENAITDLDADVMQATIEVSIFVMCFDLGLPCIL